MLSNIRQISILNKVFNLNESEWPKVILSWCVRFLYKGGFVIGWTIIVAMFTSRFGIASLPFLFAVNALFTIVGTFFYSSFLEKIDKTWVMIATIFLAGAILLLATQVVYINQILFFILLLIAEAILVIQLKIFLDGYVEEIFTPLESERTFPLIEAAETVGGIIAGVIVMSFSNQIETFKFIYLWAIFLFLMVPFILLIGNLNKKIVIIEENHGHESDLTTRKHGLIALIKEEFQGAKRFSFLKGMFILVFFQWLLYNLLEFQYTKAIYNSVSNVILDGGSGFEHAFVHDLGALFILFSASALILQLFIGSRLIDSLGIIGSMLVHPIVTLLSLVGIVVSFNFYTAVLAKNNFTLTTAIFTNAYHSTYYAIKDRLREHSREFMEGIVRPVGALAGTLTLILLQQFLQAKGMVFAVNILMILVTAIFLYVVFMQRAKYTKAALDDLVNSKEKEARMNAIDILAQKGHSNSIPVLIKVLKNDSESISLRVRVLRALAENQDDSVIKDIIECFSSSRSAIREAAVDTLLAYKSLSKSSKENSIVKYELVESLKKMYEAETYEDIRSRIIALLSKLSNVSTIEFLLNILQKDSGDIKADAIYALGNYEDIDVAAFVRPYLKSNDKEKINAAITLGRFPKFREESCYVVSSFIFSEENDKIAHGLYAVGELNLKRFRKICVDYLGSSDVNLKMNAAVALAKMGRYESVSVLVDLLFHSDHVIAKRVKNMLKNVDVRIYKNIDKIVRYIVAREINKLVKGKEIKSWADLEEHHLVSLKWLYCLIEEYDEVEVINNLI
jgi:HEAT repeat protein/ATP/ADP translocase